jgi:hypothetical protein
MTWNLRHQTTTDKRIDFYAPNLAPFQEGLFSMRCISVIVFVAATLLRTAGTPVFAQSSISRGYNSPSLAQNEDFAATITDLGSRQMHEPRRATVPASTPSLDSETDALPDMPVPKTADENKVRTSIRPAPLAGATYKAQTLPYWAVTGAVFGSNIAAIELLQRCLGINRCGEIPPGMRSRSAMYGVGLTVAAATSGVDYYVRKG